MILGKEPVKQPLSINIQLINKIYELIILLKTKFILFAYFSFSNSQFYLLYYTTYFNLSHKF